MKGGGKKEGATTRREFGKMAVTTAAGLGALPLIERLAAAAETAVGEAKVGEAQGPKDARVCLVLSKAPIPKGDEAKAVFHAMLDEGLKTIAGGKGADEFMSASFRPADRVAIKVNNFGFRGHRGPQLATAICEKLQKAGLKPENIVVFDNSDGVLKNARYSLNYDGPGFRCYGTDRTGFMDKTFKSGKTEVRFTKILESCDAIINMPSLKAHILSGVTICMKNHYGSIEEPKQFHDNACDPFIADINSIGIIKDKTRLAVCDATKVLFAGGPEWLPQCTADFNGILVATDQAALDAVGYTIIKKLRKDSGAKQLPWNPEPRQLKTAQKNGVGVTDIGRIDFVTATV